MQSETKQMKKKSIKYANKIFNNVLWKKIDLKKSIEYANKIFNNVIWEKNIKENIHKIQDTANYINPFMLNFSSVT